MSRDEIFAEDGYPEGPFEFSEAVARVFPDMLRRSIPGYAETLRAITELARDAAAPDTTFYDLGCSLGAATEAMREGLGAADCASCRVIGIDNAPAMIRGCQARQAGETDSTAIDYQCADINDIAIENASMVVMNYTLQFIAPEQRAGLVSRIAQGLRPGGVFVLSEKVVDPDPIIEAALTRLHHEFKRRHHYSDMEISRKRRALENVLVPDTVEQHRQRLADAGFARSAVWLRQYNFVSILAIR